MNIGAIIEYVVARRCHAFGHYNFGERLATGKGISTYRFNAFKFGKDVVGKERTVFKGVFAYAGGVFQSCYRQSFKRFAAVEGIAAYLQGFRKAGNKACFGFKCKPYGRKAEAVIERPAAYVSRHSGKAYARERRAIFEHRGTYAEHNIVCRKLEYPVYGGAVRTINRKEPGCCRGDGYAFKVAATAERTV